MKWVVAAALVVSAGCVTAPDHLAPSTSPAPATPWTPPASAVPPAVPERPAPPLDVPLTLGRAIDIALSNNPNTRTAWLQARIAEADIGVARSSFYPEVDANVSANRTQHATTLTPSLALTYLLFDFGGRAATVEQARQALIASDFTHNQVIQDIVLRTEQAYYGVLDAKALLDGQAATVKEQQASVDAAEARHRAGVATVADVLQAQTALSQAQLNYETFDGQLRQEQGLLATTMGIPVTTPMDVGSLPAEAPVQEVGQTVDALVAQAEVDRPELAAARSDVLRAQEHVRQVRSSYLPTVGLTADLSHVFTSGSTSTGGNPGTSGSTGSSGPSSYAVGLAMRFPLFTGFRNVYDIRAAQLGVDLAAEDARNLQQQVALQVWSSYYALNTAAQRVRTTRDLLRSAQQSLDVASGRYRSGVGTIIELLTAQAALETARAQEVQARADWFVAVAQLAHDTGTLGLRPGETR